MKRKLLATLLTLCMVIGLLPMTALAEEAAATALPEADANGVITLTEDVTSTITVNSDETVVLDLNSHNITVSSGCAIVNKGNLTIRGSGTVSASGSGNAAIANFPGASCTVNGGTYKSYNWYVIKNMGTMVIDGAVTVTTDNSTNPSSLIDNGWVSTTDSVAGEDVQAQANSANLTISSGDFNGTSGEKSCSVIKNDDYGVLTINGGTFNSSNNTSHSDATTLLNWNVATINGGTFMGSYPITNAGANSAPGDLGLLTINGGQFTGTSSIFGYSPSAAGGVGEVTVNSGTFQAPTAGGSSSTYEIKIFGGQFTDNNQNSLDISDYIPEGVALTQDASGNVVADTDNTVAQVAGLGYTTLAAAIAAAEDSDTITLLQDVEISGGSGNTTGILTITKSITLDGANHTIKAVDEVQDKSSMINIQNNANVTIKNLTIDSDSKAKHGLNINNATVAVENVTLLNGTGYGMVINGSTVTADSLTTSGNAWGGVNVDTTNSSKADSSFIMNSGTLNEPNSLYLQHSENAATTSPTVTATVNGGTFKGVVSIQDKADTAEDLDNVTLTVKGGEYANSVAAYVVEGLNYEANTSGVYTYHTTLDEALATGGEVQSVSAAAGDETTTCTVKLVNGATTTEITVSANEAIQLPTLASSGYSYFQGWQSGDALYQGGAEVEITADTTFTAQWLITAPVIPTPSQPSTPEETEEPDTDTAPTPEAWTNPYGDVAGNDWYYDAVAYVSAEGIMTGTTASTFAPNDTMTRAMVWTVLARMEGQNVEGGSPWYALAQSWAMNVAVSDGTGPNDSISREQLVTMLYRQAGSPEVGVSELAKLGQFTDGEAVSDWAQSAMAWAVSTGLLTGDAGALNPQAGATRAQVAAILMRYCQQ